VTEPENLGHVAARFDMLFARAMTAFASAPLATMHQGNTRVRILRELSGYFLMAGHASLRAQIFRGFIRGFACGATAC